jgi:hypothetical protein
VNKELKRYKSQPVFILKNDCNQSSSYLLQIEYGSFLTPIIKKQGGYYETVHSNFASQRQHYIIPFSFSFAGTNGYQP